MTLPKLQRKTQSRRPGGNRDLFMLGGIVAIALGFTYFSPGQRAQRQHDAVVRQQHQQSDANAAIADRRYREACYMAVDNTETVNGYYVIAITLSETSFPPIDPATQTPVEGRVVCDDRGFTAIAKDGELTEIAISGNSELINQRFEDALGWHENARRSGQ